MPESPMLLTIQGNIAAGKSLLYEALRKELEEKHSGEVCFVPEPVGLWKDIKGEDGKDMIEKYYGDQKKYAFAFQMMAYISRLSLLREAAKSGCRVIVSERSLETDRQIFAAMLHDEGKIEDVEYQIYLKWFDEFKNEIWNADFEKEEIVYVKADPAVCSGRVTKRGRQGESIELSYLQRCHDYHEKWLQTSRAEDRLAGHITVIDGNTDLEEEPQALDKWIEQVTALCKL